RIEPGKPSQVKIQALPAAKMLPQDRETLYYFNLREIPPKSNKPNSLQIALQTRIKLFYRPAAIAPERNAAPWQEQLTLSKQGDKYVVNNPTPYYVTLVDAASRKGVEGTKGFEPLMVPPKASLPLTVSAGSVGNSPVLTYINDYGGRPQLSFSCAGAVCKVVPEKKAS
ncbi:fimbria/pilus periplasmic chaperone, partial [Serratia ureilytica]|uniref:fimbria/pilus periplasmic chaperone n=1 Tax=Serratia ureilytica TaxID=300181 RepID=UPI002363098C